MKTPINIDVVNETLKELKLKSVGESTIRQIATLVNTIEKKTGEKFVHMEIGTPGLPAIQCGVDAEIEALKSGVASIYPPIDGIPRLKEETARFVKAFLDIDVDPKNCVPTVGSMQGSYALFVTNFHAQPEKDTVLFIDPGFPIQKSQANVIGMKIETFDIYKYRDNGFREKLESYLEKGNISAMIYSSPNNPSWISFTESELQIIGELSNKHDVLVIEDLAYLCMDSRENKGVPFEAPYQPTVAKYTDNYAIMLSGSKIFSYAGQRIGVIVMSNKLYNRPYKQLEEKYSMAEFGNAFVYMVIYNLSSGVSHSAQHALAAMFAASSDGKLNFVNETSEYAVRAKAVKKIFIKNGFHIVYDKDLDQELGDGFFFTIGYKDMSADDLVGKLIYYGVSAISLTPTGSLQSGLRACVSTIKPEQYEILDNRLSLFNNNY